MNSWQFLGSMEKAAAGIVKKPRTEYDDHCPHCDHKFHEKGYPRAKFNGDKEEWKRMMESGDYDEHCPNCGGIVDQEEQSDESIESPWLDYPGAKEKAYARREIQRKRKAAREAPKCEHGVSTPLNTCDECPTEKQAMLGQLDKEAAFPMDMLRRGVGRVATNLITPYGYHLPNKFAEISHMAKEPGGLKRLFNAVRTDTPAFEGMGAGSMRELPYRKMFGLEPRIEEGMPTLTPRNSGGFDVGETPEPPRYLKNSNGSYAFNPAHPDGARAIDEVSNDAARHSFNQSSGLAPDTPEFVADMHGVMRGYDGKLLPGGQAAYRDRWDFNLHPGEKPTDSWSNAARWAMSKITKPVNLEGTAPYTPFSEMARSTMTLPGDAGGVAKVAADHYAALRDARAATNTSPTELQKHHGNYSKGECVIHGLRIKLENPKGSTRRGVDDSGKAWASKQYADYGYFAGTRAADGDAIDVFVGPDPDAEFVVVVDQYKGKTFDESKVIMGCHTKAEATTLYLKHYPSSFALGPVSTCTVFQLKQWLRTGDHKKPFSGQMLKAAARWDKLWRAGELGAESIARLGEGRWRLPAPAAETYSTFRKPFDAAMASGHPESFASLPGYNWAPTGKNFRFELDDPGVRDLRGIRVGLAAQPYTGLPHNNLDPAYMSPFKPALGGWNSAEPTRRVSMSAAPDWLAEGANMPATREALYHNRTPDWSQAGGTFGEGFANSNGDLHVHSYDLPWVRPKTRYSGHEGAVAHEQGHLQQLNDPNADMMTSMINRRLQPTFPGENLMQPGTPQIEELAGHFNATRGTAFGNRAALKLPIYNAHNISPGLPAQWDATLRASNPTMSDGLRQKLVSVRSHLFSNYGVPSAF